MTHHLTDKDVEKRTAVCSIDGPVKIRKAGNGWTCAVRANAAGRESKRRNPARSRTSDSPHRLTWKDPETRTGLCPECGAVEIVPWGTGWHCKPHAEELGHVNHQDAPQGYCRDCSSDSGQFVMFDHTGACPRCSKSLNASIAEIHHYAAEKDDFYRWFVGIDEGAEPDEAFIFSGWTDPYEMPEHETAVAGWKTIG